ncbi:hypothetical protein KIF24_13190 [Micromonospora sp. Llam7]|uniref:hypothetical protein n=1 Tax=Micromonospora tarapacensis TaxID=2835305 RepID=UPI001C82C210|nr:hypothetical protein [Micromonospora tarapacensis]MBX7266884.1 hypothetical protein [Micromonospora tarapacensis]
MKPGDQDVARRVVRDFLMTLGDDGAMRHAAVAVCQAGDGTPDMETLLRNIRQTGDLGIDRPWQWLAAVNAEAQRLGDLHLVAEITYFVFVWDARLRGRIVSGELLLQLQLPPEQVVREVYSTALFALAEADPGRLVADRTDTVMVSSLRTALAHAVLDADPPFPAHVSAAARQLVNG